MIINHWVGTREMTPVVGDYGKPIGSQILPSADLFRPTVARLTLRSATSSAGFRIVFHW